MAKNQGTYASIEFGLPATIKFTDIIEGDAAYKTIKRRLKRYLHNPASHLIGIA